MVTIVLLCLAAIWVAIALLCRRVKHLPEEMGRITEKLPLTKVGLIACCFCAAVAVAMLLIGEKQAPLLAAFAVLSAGLVHPGLHALSALECGGLRVPEHMGTEPPLCLAG